MIQISNLSKAFGSNLVLNHLSIQFTVGKVHGIVGKNGAGKSTFFNCMVGLDSFDGEINSELQPLKNHCSFLPTNPFFFSHMTGLEYLKMVCNANQVELPDKESLLFQLPYDRYAITYSTGMKKKLAFQGIVLENKEFIVLDEPFNGVDLESNYSLIEQIKEWSTQGKTILIASHIFSTLQKLCDEIHWLEGGSFKKCIFPHEYSIFEEELKAKMKEVK